MHKVGNEQYKLIVTKYKVRREDDYFIVFFPEIGEYYAANEIGVDILRFFFQSDEEELFSYLEKSYELFSSTQRQLICDYVQELCTKNLIIKGDFSNEGI